MNRIPIEQFPTVAFKDDDVIKGWKWFISFLSEKEWIKRKRKIEKAIEVDFTKSIGDPDIKETKFIVKDDLIDWYLYLVEMFIYEQHKYEYFQGARIVPIFQRFGSQLELLKSIGGIERKVKDVLRKRQPEADAFLFEILTALLWRMNGYDVSFNEETGKNKSPDFVASKDGATWSIECKRQSKTADYTYLETAKRKQMFSHIRDILLEKNILLDIVFHTEIVPLSETYLKDLLQDKIPLAIPGKIVSNAEIDIELSYVDIEGINDHLENYFVKYNSPMMNWLISQKRIDGHAFSYSMKSELFRVGKGNANNVYICEMGNACGVHWKCDAEEALTAKARDIKRQLYSALEQFNSEDTAIIHIGMDTLEGAAVEQARINKIQDTIVHMEKGSKNLKWVLSSFFQAYSLPDVIWTFDETMSSITMEPGTHPLDFKMMIIPPDGDLAEDIFHWQRPMP